MHEPVKKDRVIIVDDEEDIRLNLCDFMELEGYEVLNAENGVKALQIVQEQQLDLIVSDLMMPEMGGMELLEELSKRENPIPIIIMTVFGTIDYAVKAMKVGAADFITKPLDYDHMLTIIRRVLRTARLEQKVKEQQQQMEMDLQFAGKIQTTLLPPPIDNQFLSLNYRFEPLIDIGGDHLAAFQYDEDHFAIALLDVMGHGVSAALVATMLHNELMSRLKEERPPFNVVQHLHRFVEKTIGDTSIFLTLAIADVNLMTHTLIICNAGHPEIYIWKHGDNSLESINAHVPAVGFPMMMMDGDVTESKIPLQSGDRMILYTDGFPETMKHNGEILGKDRFQQLIKKHIRLRSLDFLNEVFREIDALRTGEPEDDRTLVLIEIK